MSRFLALFALAAAVDVSGLRGEQKTIVSGNKARTLVKSLEVKRQLRVCNAYPYPTALDVFRNEEHVTDKEPMAYKQCQDFKLDLAPGDKLIFKVGDANAGTFSVADLPNTDAVLMLVVYRHDTLSTAVAFESHVYANLLNAQVAIVDTYKGPEIATIRIADHEDSKTSRQEDLRFDSVVAVNAGMYDALLVGKDGTKIMSANFVALDHESYILMRTGVKAQQGTSYSQELVVFPNSDSNLLGSAALRALGLVLFALMFQ